MLPSLPQLIKTTLNTSIVSFTKCEKMLIKTTTPSSCFHRALYYIQQQLIGSCVDIVIILASFLHSSVICACVQFVLWSSREITLPRGSCLCRWPHSCMQRNAASPHKLLHCRTEQTRGGDEISGNKYTITINKKEFYEKVIHFIRVLY